MSGHTDRISKYGQNLKGKVALITGSSRGIGAACAIRFAEHGADVVINYVQAAKQAEQVSEQCKALGVRTLVVQADVTKSEDIENMFKKTMDEFGRVDIVYSNSGKEHWGKAGEVPEHEFDEIFHVNVRSQWFVSQMAAKYMSEYGRLILISSISAQKGVAKHSLYASTKSAIQGMARCLAVDLGGKGITVNVVAPGGIKTDMYTHAAAKYIPGGDKMSEQEIDDMLARWSPLNRVGFPDDVAGTVAILASEEAQWLTGQVLHCSGGAHMAGS